MGNVFLDHVYSGSYNPTVNADGPGVPQATKIYALWPFFCVRALHFHKRLLDLESKVNFFVATSQ